MLGGGDLVPVEAVTATAFALELDALAGVDAWQVLTDVGMRPLGSRVQAGWDYRTFSIRYSLRSGHLTEIDKRITAIRRGLLYPSITVQAYLECPINPFEMRLRFTTTALECRSWATIRCTASD